LPADGENNATKELSVYKKLVLGLHEIMLPGLLFKYARNTAYKNRGKAEWWEKTGLLVY
jgi:hypothetical protein